MAITQEQLDQALAGIEDRYLGKDLLAAKALKSSDLEGEKAFVRLVVNYPAGSYRDELKQQLEEALTALDEGEVEVLVEQRIAAQAVQKSLKRIEGIKNIVAVASGKGGVGKSTTAVNLALALRADGASVGLLDADIYGPSQPRMMGLSGHPQSDDGQTLEPMENHGIKTMSIGFLIEEDSPMIWRGPMVTQALQQLLNDTNWGELDYLVIDLPPGTGDTQLTLSQKIPVSGAVVVTTPQDIALLDALKGLKMFEKVEVPVLGVVENMSIHICSECGHAEHIFGQGGGVKMAEDNGVEMLGSLPLEMSIREQVDSGNPTVASDPEGKIAGMYFDISRKMAAKLAQQAKDYSTKFPNIVIQND